MTDPMKTAPLDRSALNEGDRPKAPALPGVTEAQRAKGRGLAAIHRHYLQDVARIAMVIARIRAGDDPPEHMMQVILSADMAQNLRAFGNLCGQQCRMLGFHHAAEEHGIFPELDQKAPDGIRAIIAKLRAEHEVVHALLEELMDAARTIVEAPTEENFAATSDAFERLEAVIRSHFHYEETELEEAIGVFSDGL